MKRVKKFRANWMNWRGRREISKNPGCDVRFYKMPHFEWDHQKPVHCVQDPHYGHTFQLWILWGWGGLHFRYDTDEYEASHCRA